MPSWLRLDGYEVYAALLAVAWTTYSLTSIIKDRRSRAIRSAADAAGRSEPPSLHPVIDPARCIGCGACTNVCPEGKVLGLIGGRAELIAPSACIGHGACRTACPAGAIDLVFGTARRGVDIPHVSPDYETNVPGVFIAGELGGMGLIANAVEQGRQAVRSIARLKGKGRRSAGNDLDLVIVGAGPAGISASLAAKELGLRAVTLEQASVGGTVAQYPRGKMVVSRPVELPLFGRIKYRKVRKEKLLGLFREAMLKQRIAIRHGESVERILTADPGFEVVTQQRRYRCRAVLLATGRRASPRRLEADDGRSAKVFYGLRDPAAFRFKRVLVVGGGNSALEAAVRIANTPHARVALSYRGASFERANAAILARVEAAVAAGHLKVYLDSTVTAIEPRSVTLTSGGRSLCLANDAIVACTGGTLPAELLADLGIAVETKRGTR
jgi:thioredoxin reductase/NAD-dependent dihydropyrimidine dehydrogenase PreA subunit